MTRLALLQERDVAEGVVADEVRDLLRHDSALLHGGARPTHAVHGGARHHIPLPGLARARLRALQGDAGLPLAGLLAAHARPLALPHLAA